jgi:hypothetical protein
MTWMGKVSVIEFLVDVRLCLLASSSKLAVGTHQSSHPMGNGDYSILLMIKVLEHDVDNSSPSRPED